MTCCPDKRAVNTRYRAASFPALATGLLQLSAPGPATVAGNPSPVPGPEAVQTDPVAGGALPATTGGCRVMGTTTDPGVAAWPWSPRSPGTLVGAPAARVT